MDAVGYMGTYVADPKVWEEQFQVATGSIPAEKLWIGLETTEQPGGAAYPLDEVERRLARCTQAGVSGVGLWKAPVPDDWWPLLKRFSDGSGEMRVP